MEAAEIGIISFPDHAPMAISMRLDPPKQSTFNWRLNASLLTDQRVKDELHDILTEYFRNNLDADTNPLTNREAHKSFLRGHLMKWGSRKKREKEKEISKLTLQIARLESLHKQSLSISIEEELIQCRNSLKLILDLKIRKALFFKKSIYFEHGDKSGKLLAKALKDMTQTGKVQAIRDKDGKPRHKPTDIAELFRKFYSSLYNLPEQHKPSHLSSTKQETIHQFLKDSKIPSLTQTETN